jgi:hypothetical protein
MNDFLSTALYTAIGAFAGTFSAIILELVLRYFQRWKDEAAAGNRALFSLSVILNSLVQYQKDVVNPHRMGTYTWLNLPVSLPLDRNDTAFDLKELSFLFNRKSARVLQDVMLQGVRFRSTLTMIEEHRELVLRDVFPPLSAHDIRISQLWPSSEIEEVLGTATVHKLQTLVPAIILNIDQNVVSTRTSLEELRKVLVKHYPRKKFIEPKFLMDEVAADA